MRHLRQRTGLVVCLAITLGCAAVFLGVKAIEYTHKWDLGLLPAAHTCPNFWSLNTTPAFRHGCIR